MAVIDITQVDLTTKLEKPAKKAQFARIQRNRRSRQWDRIAAAPLSATEQKISFLGPGGGTAAFDLHRRTASG
jgi:hypothetical protein